ncbi:PPC domain-containing DNA-binding protein [Sorangium sp. So ce1151]|uniref:PPC domain-containing DNA-binding protein n=1 Tax=Sorangium sp. So ce1151 TaxID=3133332 RepID=UPI003F5F2C07
MNVLEARRARHLIIRLDRGEELPAALVRALDEAEARAGWIEGAGSLEQAEIALFDQASRTYAKTRVLDGPCDVVALSGSIALQQGETSLRLSATLARESGVGLQLAAGELVWARVYGLELRVTAFDDLPLVRVLDARTGLTQLTAQSTTLPAIVGEPPRAAPPAQPAEPTRAAPPAQPAEPTRAAPPAQPAEPTRAAPPAQPAEPTRAAPPAQPAEPPRAVVPPAPAAEPTRAAPAAAAVESSAVPLPQRPVRRRQEEEAYPEVGDSVTHFHFGDCTVISSDGERIRLRQERDGRVREVSLTMLRIEPPTVDPATGKKQFRLARKN